MSGLIIPYVNQCSLSLPHIFGVIILGPVPAITEALKKAGLTLKDMDLVEVCYTQCRNYINHQTENHKANIKTASKDPLLGKCSLLYNLSQLHCIYILVYV